MQTINGNNRYQVFFMYHGNQREFLASFRYYTHAYIFRKDLEASDPDGNFWIEDHGEMPPGC